MNGFVSLNILLLISPYKVTEDKMKKIFYFIFFAKINIFLKPKMFEFIKSE